MRRTGKQGEARRQRLGKRRKKATKARIRAGGTAQAMGKETEQGATRRGCARQAVRRAGDGRKTGCRARHKVEAQAARGESRRRGKAQGHERRRKRSEMQKRQESAGPQAGSPPPVSSCPAPPQSTSCPGCAAGDGRFSQRQKKNTGAEARFCLREPRRSHRHFTTCRFPKSSGRHRQRVRSRTPSRTPHYPCGLPSPLCLRCFGERTTSPF